MKILGINGWRDWFHDPSACIVVDNVLLAFCEEERFVREKHAPDRFPICSVQWCMANSKSDWSEMDYVAVGWDVPAFGRKMTEQLSIDDCKRGLLLDLGAPDDFPLEKIIFVNHHISHAMSGVLLSTAEQSLVLVVDGQGEEESTSLFRFTNNQLFRLFKLDSRYSLGYFYEAASAFTGLGLTGTGKLMGLSSYGKPLSDLYFKTGVGEAFETPIPINFLENSAIRGEEEMDDAKLIAGDYWLNFFNHAYPGMQKENCFCKLSFAERNALHENIDAVEFAATVQESLELAVISMIQKHILPEDEAIIVVGGVGLNCKMNGKLLEIFPDKKIIVQPLANDAGVSLGAATYVALKKTSKIVDKGDFPYVGPNYSDVEIEKQLQIAGCVYQYLKNPVSTAAKMLEQGLIIGWFQGRAEVGPRALGARSILARPDSTEIRDKINLEIKHREYWRPLAPAILNNEAGFYYERCSYGPYMLFGFDSSSPETRKLFEGTIHVDGTSRVQTVGDYTPKRFRDLICEFQKLTGIPGVLNTSFNIAEEPVVCTPADAIKSFRSTGLDVLFIGNFVVYREG